MVSQSGRLPYDPGGSTHRLLGYAHIGCRVAGPPLLEEQEPSAPLQSVCSL